MGGDTTGSETVHQLLGEVPVGNDTDSLGVELLDHLESKIDQFGLATLADVVGDNIGGVVKDLAGKPQTHNLVEGFSGTKVRHSLGGECVIRTAVPVSGRIIIRLRQSRGGLMNVRR